MPQKVANWAQESYSTFLYDLKKLWNLVFVLHDFNRAVKSMKMILPHFSCFSGQFLTFFLGSKKFKCTSQGAKICPQSVRKFCHLWTLYSPVKTFFMSFKVAWQNFLSCGRPIFTWSWTSIYGDYDEVILTCRWGGCRGWRPHGLGWTCLPPGGSWPRCPSSTQPGGTAGNMDTWYPQRLCLVSDKCDLLADN